MNREQLREIAKLPGIQTAAHWVVAHSFSDGTGLVFGIAAKVHGPEGTWVPEEDKDELMMLALLEGEPAESASVSYADEA